MSIRPLGFDMLEAFPGQPNTFRLDAPAGYLDGRTIEARIGKLVGTDLEIIDTVEADIDTDAHTATLNLVIPTDPDTYELVIVDTTTDPEAYLVRTPVDVQWQHQQSPSSYPFTIDTGDTVIGLAIVPGAGGGAGGVVAVVAGAGVEVDDDDPANPVVGLSSGALSALGAAATAVQPDDLGTAAGANVSDFATSAQGGLADTAVQPDDLGGAALLDVGTTAGTVAAGDDARLSDARTPTAHAASHAAGQSDEVTPASIGAVAASSGLVVVTYAGNVSAARPTAAAVYWLAFPAEPTHIADGDIWYEPA